jgi:hypothetical protein
MLIVILVISSREEMHGWKERGVVIGQICGVIYVK